VLGVVVLGHEDGARRRLRVLERIGAQQAAEIAERGTKSGETGDEYVRITVLLATVLLITAIGQRFSFRAVRIIFMILACLLLCLPLLRLLMLPRI
jgi:hypothetical protein